MEIAFNECLMRGISYQYKAGQTLNVKQDKIYRAAFEGTHRLNSDRVTTVSNCVHLFLDDQLIHRMVSVKREVEQPARHAANPLIVPEYPWERRMLSLYGTVMYDPSMGKFRCWYLGNENPSQIPDTPEAPGTSKYHQCYAESNDGIHWRKPLVGEKPYGGHDRHNIVVTACHGWCVLYDPDDPDPRRRYKGLGGKRFGYSPDGIHWETRAPWEAVGRKNDTSACVVRWKDEYLAFVRYVGPQNRVEDEAKGIDWWGNMRMVGICASKDFDQWTPKEMVFRTDEKDGYPWTQPYGLCVTPYGDVLIALVPMLYLEPRQDNNSYGPMDVQLAVSRDGRHWNRVAERATFMALTEPAEGEDRPWDMRVYPGTTMFVRDDQVYIYYTGSNTLHGERPSGTMGRMGIGLATLPADRFVAIIPSSAATEGILETKVLRSPGGDLVVNVVLDDVEALRVEVLDSGGQVLEGFGREACRLTVHDKLRYSVSWQSKDDAPRPWSAAMRDNGNALRFILRRGAKLYAFQFVN
ncbi:MAG: hypothetical protein IT445_03250 [Phycisphaeraceae bacterium]|nr:hypothetical protein [Phycisphaeraceae bacterium]